MASYNCLQTDHHHLHSQCVRPGSCPQQSSSRWDRPLTTARRALSSSGTTRTLRCIHRYFDQKPVNSQCHRLPSFIQHYAHKYSTFGQCNNTTNTDLCKISSNNEIPFTGCALPLPCMSIWTCPYVRWDCFWTSEAILATSRCGNWTRVVSYIALTIEQPQMKQNVQYFLSQQPTAQMPWMTRTCELNLLKDHQCKWLPQFHRW